MALPTGPRLRAARKQARLTQEELAARAGIPRQKLIDLEQGKPGVAIDKFLAVIEALGLELELTPKPEKAPRIRLNKFPELRQLAWNRPGNEWIDEHDALALYERNWRYVDKDHMTPEERALLQHLVAKHGGGILHV